MAEEGEITKREKKFIRKKDPKESSELIKELEERFKRSQGGGDGKKK